MPTHWAGDELKEINFDVIRYYLASATPPNGLGKRFLKISSALSKDWVSRESERKFLAGVEAQFDSEAVYSNIKARRRRPRRHLHGEALTH